MIRGRGRGRWIVGGLLLVALLVGLGLWFWRLQVEQPDQPTVASPEEPVVGATERIVPDSVRIKVEVLNGSTTRGLARRGTAHLRGAGFDVVSSGNTTERPESTLVLIRSGNREWAEWAARALGGARIEARPDTSRYLDLTIVLAARWRPPTKALYP